MKNFLVFGEHKVILACNFKTKSDLLIINKTDLAPMVGANLSVMDQDAKRMRGDKPFLFSNMKTKEGLEIIISFIEKQGLFKA